MNPLLTEPQLAAFAKVAFAIEGGAGAALLCGPPGVGKTTVLNHLATEIRLAGHSCVVADVGAWLADGNDLPDVVIADNAHAASESDLTHLLVQCQTRRPVAALVLAGQGRLLTLVARDRRLEQAVRLRAAILPGRLVDTAGLLAAGEWPPLDEEATALIHDVAAGIPADVVRLRSLVAVVAGSSGEGRMTTEDIEVIYQQLTPMAA